MPQTVTITLTLTGTDTGPFNLYSDVDGFLSPFQTGVPKGDLVVGETFYNVPDGATTIRVKSTGVCTNYIDLVISGTTTTTTTTSTTSTTTVSPVVNYLFVFVRDIGVGANAAPTLRYTRNGGPLITLGSVSTGTCTLSYSIFGISPGDVILFTSTEGYAMNGSNGSNVCPAPIGSNTYSYTIPSPGVNNVSLSFNRDIIV